MANQVQPVIDSATALLQSVADFDTDKVFTVLDVDDLFSQTVSVAYPAAGVIYEGMRPTNGDQGKHSHRTGMSAELGIAIVLVVENTYPQGTDNKPTAIEILDSIRQKFKDLHSPAGHVWRFVLEAPAVTKGNLVVWVQRWATPIQLTPAN